MMHLPPDLSAKSRRHLERLGVLAALARGETLVLAGPTYALREDPETVARLAFLEDEEGRFCVGHACRRGGEWAAVDTEPFSLRALGYHERRLKRVGTRLDASDAR